MALGCLLTVVAACSNPGGAKPRDSVGSSYYSSASAVCALLEGRDLETILGHQYLDGVGDFNPDTQFLTGVNACSYGRADNPRRKIYLGVVYAYSDQIFGQTSSFLHRAFPQPGKIVTVKGIGKKAFWWDDLNLLFVLTEGKMIALKGQADLEPARDRLIRVRRLAEKAVARLR
ncbi:MAG: hypothetical protein ACR2FO_05125 [Actinomycetota bacterium]